MKIASCDYNTLIPGFNLGLEPRFTNMDFVGGINTQHWPKKNFESQLKSSIKPIKIIL